MPGMGHGLQTDNPTIAAAFRNALDHQLLILIVLGVVLALAWNLARTVQYRRAVAAGTLDHPVAGPVALPRTPGPPAVPHRLRTALAVRRPPPDPGGHAPRPARLGDHPGGWLLARMGPARGQPGNHCLVGPPGDGGGGHGVDPGGHRGVPAGGPPGLLVAGGGPDQRRLGPGGLGVRRSIRWGLRSRQQLALRVAGGGAVLRGGRLAGGPARPMVGDAPVRPGPAPGDGRLLRRDGGPAGVARARLLVGPGPTVGHDGDPDRDGPADVPGVPAVGDRARGSGRSGPSRPGTAGWSTSPSWRR